MPCLPDEKCCFHCGEWFSIRVSRILCSDCDQYQCPECGCCGCHVGEQALRAIRAMEKTYERFLKRNLVSGDGSVVTGCRACCGDSAVSMAEPRGVQGPDGGA